MITTKRILSLLLVLIMVLALASCGNNDTKKEETQSNIKGGINMKTKDNKFEKF